MTPTTTKPSAPAGGNLLFEGAEWDFETVRRVYDAVERLEAELAALRAKPVTEAADELRIGELDAEIGLHRAGGTEGWAASSSFHKLEATTRSRWANE